MAWQALRQFMRYEASAGALLFIATAFALIMSNTPLHGWYEHLLALRFAFHVGDWSLAKPLLLWVNDGLMAIFFLLVGLEMKREMLQGELNSLKRAALPGIAALGGMLLPALVYLAFNYHHPVWRTGWAIPAATDIAFSLAVLMVLGKRLPPNIKVFLTAVAIFDDIGVIVIIALFYTAQLSMSMLLLALLCLVVLVVLNRFKVRHAAPYALVGLILWFCVLKSGVHATLAGVALAWAIPLEGHEEHPPLERWESNLHPWVAYVILPIFAFMNAGVRLEHLVFSDLLHPVTLGCALGLFLGKPLGIWGFSMSAVRSGIAKLPKGVSGVGVFGTSLVAGIGFTMSLFVGSLAFFGKQGGLFTRVQLGVFVGSILSGCIGYMCLRFCNKRS